MKQSHTKTIKRANMYVCVYTEINVENPREPIELPKSF